jgi:lipoate-protein ligase A
MPTSTDARGEQAWNAAALAARPLAPALRVWLWPQPAIVLGCAQRRLQPEVAARSPVEVLVREAGGGAVLVGPWMIGVSLVLPCGDPRAGRSPTDGYRWLALELARALAEAGFPARALAPADLAASRLEGGPSLWVLPPGQVEPVGWACYGSLSAWEIVDEAGRKRVGLAQRRTRDAVLLVAGVLASPPDWALLATALGQPADAVRLRALTSACLAAPDGVSALASAIETELGVALETTS